jgi:hypothetical protein
MTIRKPAAWENLTFEDLLSNEAGQAYVADQLGGNVDPVATFHSNRTGSDSCTYELFEDGSLWFVNSAQDEVWPDVSDFAIEMQFDGLYWDEFEGRDGLLVDAMDRGLLIHLYGEDGALDFFERAGGIVGSRS